MERLTVKHWRNLDPWECCGQDNYCKRGCHEEGGCARGCIVPKLYDRLAEYEETGLSPKGVAAAKNFPSKFFPDIEKLEEFYQAQQEGRVVVLPCKVRSKVYRIYAQSWIGEDEVMDFIVLSPKHIAYTDDKGRGTNCMMFGKTVFLTREEAEAALKERVNSEHTKTH